MKLTPAIKKKYFESELIKIAPFQKELLFASPRKFRFDYCFSDVKLAIEVEGGVWEYGRHNRPEGYFKDMIKYNLAVEKGYSVLRYNYEMILKKETIEQIEKVYSSLKEKK